MRSAFYLNLMKGKGCACKMEKSSICHIPYLLYTFSLKSLALKLAFLAEKDEFSYFCNSLSNRDICVALRIKWPPSKSQYICRTLVWGEDMTRVLGWDSDAT